MRLYSFDKLVDKDFLIVGQGIAGSLLGYELMQRGCQVTILNQTNSQSSSRVAAGLYNPITGRKMVKTWNCDKIFPQLESYYEALQTSLGSEFLYKKRIYRPFFTIEEQNDWQGRVGDNSIRYLINKLRISPTDDPMTLDPYGGLLLNNSGYVDLNAMLNSLKEYFIDRGSYQEGLFNIGELDTGSIQVGEKTFDQVIFCDGTGLSQNKYFDWLPSRPVKGEVLEIKIEDYIRDDILNRGVFLVPLTNGHFRLGATYDNHDLSLQPTRQAINYLSQKLNLIFSKKFDIISHAVGIRPATKDRRPLIGLHPSHSNVGIFNGFGAKGVSLAMYYSQQFADHLAHGKPLDEEVNISRFFSLFSSR